MGAPSNATHGLRCDIRGRVPFAVMAVLLLVGTAVLAALISDIEGWGDGDDTVERDRRTIASVEDSIRDLAQGSATVALERCLMNGSGPEEAIPWAKDIFLTGSGDLSADGGAGGADALSITIEDLELGLDLEVPFPTGRVVGTVHWAGTSPEGTLYRRATAVDEELARPFSLVLWAEDRISLSGEEGGDLALLVRAMLFKLAAVRVASGELEGAKVITGADVRAAVDLAIDVYLNTTGEDGSLTPEDRFLGLMGETKVRSSTIMAQYLMGLLDYYLLWFRDYTGIGEGAEAFFEWVGQRMDDDDGPPIREDVDGFEEDFDEWWMDLKVREVVERWALRMMSALIRVVIEIYDDDDIDIRDLDFDDIADSVAMSLGRTGPDEDMTGVDGVMEAPQELLEAVDGLVANDGDAAGLASWIRDAVVDVVLGSLEGMVTEARDMAIGSWRDMALVDGLHGMTVTPSLDLLSGGRSEDGGQGTSQRGLVSRHLEATGITVERSELDVSGEISAKGHHHTAPEERLARIMDGIMDPGKGKVLKGLRPYEADYRVKVVGDFTVERFMTMERDLLSGLVVTDVIETRMVVPINISIVVPVFSGVPLRGIDHDPTDTLARDLRELVWEFVNRTWAGLQWVAGSMSRLADGVQEALRELGSRGLENLGRMSAAAFSRTVEDVLKALYNRAWNDAVNLTWRFIRQLIGEDLKEMLTFDIGIFGFDLRISIDLFAETLEIAHSSDRWGFVLYIKRLAEDVPPFRPAPVDGFGYCLIGMSYLTIGRLSVEAIVDPLTVVNPFVLSVQGELRSERGKGFRFEMHGPLAYKRYDVKEVSISSATGTPIQGIPVPGTGLKVDIDAGLRIKHGKGIKDPDKMLIGAVRKAWYATLQGYTVKELYGEFGDPELLEAFMVQLLNNIIDHLGDMAAEELPELELYIEGGISTAGGMAESGFSISFIVKDPVHVLWELAPWFVDNIRAFLLRMASPGLPTGFVGIPSFVSEHLFIRGFVYSEVGAPDVIDRDGAAKVRLGGLVEANIPALAALVGRDRGRWMVHAGILLPDLPSAMAAFIPGFSAPRPRCDLWMVELSVMELDNDRAKIGEVYYDTENLDNEEEYIEVWNPTGRRIDMSRWVVVDNGGRWRLPDHLSLAPGARMVIARDRDGFRHTFGELPDVHGLPLSLNNDGDAVSLYDPYGVEIDSVAWGGYVHGWDLRCDKGEALHRRGKDTDSPNDWYCAGPDPGH